MCRYSVTARDGVPHDWHLVHRPVAPMRSCSARPRLRDPHLALRAAHELGAGTAMSPSQYLRARPEANDGAW